MKRKADNVDPNSQLFESINNLNFNVDVNTSSLNNTAKRRKLNKPKQNKTEENNNEVWVSGTKVANYLLNEPVLDWMNMYYNKANISTIKNNSKCRSNSNKTFNIKKNINPSNPMENIMNNGNLFENKVVEHIRQQFPNEVVEIFTKGADINDNKYFNQTKDHIKKGTPIIAQGVLINYQNMTRGIADIIIRSDYINKLFKREILKKEEIYHNNKYYYIIIDIKYSHIPLCANGMTIRNEGRFKAYKGQLLIYNCILGLIQNYTPKFAFIMGKSWHIDKKNNEERGYNTFDLLGKIDYEKFDFKYIDLTKNAICWMNDLKTNGKDWSPLNPHCNEMYFNASNKDDYPWTEIKKDILSQTEDVTNIWMVGPEHRANALKHNIKKWSDKNLTSNILGIKSEKIKKTVDSILKVNRSKKIKILPKKIKNNLGNWKQTYPSDFYIDFETLDENFFLKNNSINIENSKSFTHFIFMIGVGYEYKGEWKYKVFKCDNYTQSEEKRILKKFKKFLNKKTKKLNKDQNFPTRLIHWSKAEKSFLSNALDRHPELISSWNKNEEWLDLYEMFTSEPITINGALTFKLKEIAKAMHKHKFINTTWDSGVQDGLNAMNLASEYYTEQNEITIEKFNHVTKYNEVDCKTLYEMLKFLRSY